MDQSSEDSSSVVLPVKNLTIKSVVTVSICFYFLFVCFTFPNFVTCSSLFCCGCTF